MQNGSPIEPRPPSLAKHPLARLMSVLRGDKYMVDAYGPPPKER